MKLSKSIPSLLVAAFSLIFIAVCLLGQTTAIDNVKFEVMAIRLLTSQEAASRSPDFVGPNVTVRLRLSNQTDEGVYFYTWEKSVIPQGYKVKKSSNGIVWLYGKPGQEPPSSPGIKSVTSGFPGVWVVLPPHSAIEWEELDSTYFGGQRHAFTCFVKRKESDDSTEIFSEWFDVPSNRKSQ